MKNELILKIQMIETLAGQLRLRFGNTLEADEIFLFLNTKRLALMEELTAETIRTRRIPFSCETCGSNSHTECSGHQDAFTATAK